MAAPSFLSPLLAAPPDAIVDFFIRPRGTERTLATRIETAFTSAERRKGLLGRDTFEPGSALIIAPCNSIHMFFMRFAIDVAFVDRRGVVVKVRHGLAPWRIAIAVRAFAAIELPTGALDRAGVSRGVALEIAPR